MNAADLPSPPPATGQVLDARLHLFDRQVLDIDGEPVTALDDVEIAGLEFDGDIDPERPPVITALIAGPILSTRLFGGRVPSPRLHRIGWKVVQEIGIVISLGVRGEELDATWPDRWLARHVIGRIPGGRHDPD